MACRHIIVPAIVCQYRSHITLNLPVSARSPSLTPGDATLEPAQPSTNPKMSKSFKALLLLSATLALSAACSGPDDAGSAANTRPVTVISPDVTPSAPPNTLVQTSPTSAPMVVTQLRPVAPTPSGNSNTSSINEKTAVPEPSADSPAPAVVSKPALAANSDKQAQLDTKKKATATETKPTPHLASPEEIRRLQNYLPRKTRPLSGEQ